MLKMFCASNVIGLILLSHYCIYIFSFVRYHMIINFKVEGENLTASLIEVVFPCCGLRWAYYNDCIQEAVSDPGNVTLIRFKWHQTQMLVPLISALLLGHFPMILEDGWIIRMNQPTCLSYLMWINRGNESLVLHRTAAAATLGQGNFPTT